MAFEIEAMQIATDAFIRNVCDQLELSDEQRHTIEDAAVDLPAELATCGGQSEVNEMVSVRIGETTNYDQNTQMAIAGSTDFFWQMYNDAAESDIEV